MGLDQYLNKKTYIGNKWKDKNPETMIRLEKSTDPETQEMVTGIKSHRIKEITEEVAYWRKANAIHKWFVDNVQNGKDDCGEYYVSQKQLKELLDRCNKVIAASKLVKGKIKNGERFTMEDGTYIEDSTVARELLPVAEEFFFGSTAYDEWYLDNIKYTKEVIEAAIAEKHGEFYYSSSW